MASLPSADLAKSFVQIVAQLAVHVVGLDSEPTGGVMGMAPLIAFLVVEIVDQCSVHHGVDWGHHGKPDWESTASVA
jgi:hypothetical protein